MLSPVSCYALPGTDHARATHCPVPCYRRDVLSPSSPYGFSVVACCAFATPSVMSGTDAWYHATHTLCNARY
eukprot:1331802-Rhodomonas_salina.1